MATSSYIVKMHWRSIKTVFGYLAYMMIYVNNCTHAGQDGIFRGENVMLVIPDGKYIRREENLSVTLVIFNPREALMVIKTISIILTSSTIALVY